MEDQEKFKRQLWKHIKSGHLYQIKTFFLRESDLSIWVLYQRQFGEGPEFSRPAWQFFDGRFRMELFEDAPEEPEGIER